MKPFITDKGHCTSEDYMLEENEDLIRDDKKYQTYSMISSLI